MQIILYIEINTKVLSFNLFRPEAKRFGQGKNDLYFKLPLLLIIARSMLLFW
jgi:hypothetical protein